MSGAGREDWIARWKEGRIGFHQEKPNDLLVRHFPKLDLPRDSHCFVPLCGKSMDMVWIAKQQQQITGIEISSLAIQLFFQSIEVSHPTIVAMKTNLISHRSAPYHLIEGDFFDLKPSQIPPVDWIYDRAAFIAFPLEEQPLAASHLASFLTKGKKMMLLTLEYPEGQTTGPPFSVNETQVVRCFEKNFDIQQIECVDCSNENNSLSERGVTKLYESIYFLTKR